MRSKITATVLGAALLIGTGQAAVAAQDVEVVQPPDAMTFGFPTWVGDYEVTEGAVYMTTDASPFEDVFTVRIWRRDLLPTADGVALGNAEYVGTASRYAWNGGIKAVGDGIVFADENAGRRLVRLDDDGTRTFLSTTGAQPVDSASASWYTSVDQLWPVPADRAGAVGGTQIGERHVARVLHLSWPARVFKIVLPASLPLIFTGLRLSLGVGWMVLIAAEMLAQNPGLGKFVWDMFQNGSSQTLAQIMVAVFTIGGIGYLLDRIMLSLQRAVSFGAVAR